MKWWQWIGQCITGFRPDGSCVRCGKQMHSDAEHSVWAQGPCKREATGRGRRMTPDQIEQARQVYRERLIEALAHCYPTVEGDEGCGADIALDALIAFERCVVMAKKDPLDWWVQAELERLVEEALA